MTEINPSLSWETSVLGTKILIESLIKYKVKNLIYASSGSVYGIKKEKLVNNIPAKIAIIVKKIKIKRTIKKTIKKPNYIEAEIHKNLIICSLTRTILQMPI